MKKNLLFFGFFITAIFFVRLFAVLGTDGFSDDISYDVLRQVESIRETGTPLFEDSQSYLGSQRLFNPLIYYLLSPFVFENSILSLQIVLQVLFLLSITLIFVIGITLGLKKRFSYIMASLWAILPISTIVNLNSLSYIVLLTPFFLLWFYTYILWVKNQTNKSFAFLLVAQFILILLHPSGLISLLAMLITLFYTKIDQRPIVRKEKELMLFLSIFGTGLYYFLFYKALLFHGLDFFFQKSLTMPFISIQSMLSLMAQLGFIFIPLAVYSLVIYTQHSSIVLRFSSRLLGALMSIVAVLFVIRLFSFTTAFYLFGLFSIILVGLLLQYLNEVIEKTKFANYLSRVFVVCLLIVIFTFTLFSYYYTISTTALAPSTAEKEIYQYAKENLDTNAVILTPLSSAFETMYYTEKKTVADQDSLLKRDVLPRMNLLNQAYSSSFLAPFLENAEEFGISHKDMYIIFDNQQLPAYISTSCISLLKNESNVLLYWIGCDDS